MTDLTIRVVRLSDSFGDLWEPLAREAGASVALGSVDQPPAWVPGLGALILAAGGAEAQAVEWLEQHEVPVGVSVLVVGADTSRRVAIRMLAHGATDYFALPDDIELLRNTLFSLIGRTAKTLAVQAAVAEREPAFAALVGQSASMRGLLARASKVLNRGDATALLIGETGTGKELLARALHEGGPRRAAPFVTVNCSALPSHLIESELFGHERGAFTDAHTAKPGLFEVADGGTLFLDELGTLPVELQAKLLRVLEDKEVRRVGGTKGRIVDVRIIAATNEDLHTAVRDGRFRQDLFFRLSVITFALPPLRERDDDVVHVANHLIGILAAHHGIPAPALTPEVKRVLVAHTWPGNVRELKNALERALLMSEPGSLDVDELVPSDRVTIESGGPLPFPAPLDDIATAAARATVDLCSGNRSEAARRLKISRRRLRRLLDEELMSA